MWVELNNHKHALRASGSCDIPKQTMANNQIQPYIFDPDSDRLYVVCTGTVSDQNTT